LLAVAGVAVCAHAGYGFSYEFSTDGGATYGNDRSIDVTLGAKQVLFRVVAYADPGTTATTGAGTGPVVAFARLTGSEVLTNFGNGSVGDSLGAMTRGEMTQGNPAYLTNSFGSDNMVLGGTLLTSFASQLLLSGALVPFCPSVGGTPKLEWIVRTGTMTIGQTGARMITFHNNTRTQLNWNYDLVVGSVRDLTSKTPDGPVVDRLGTLEVIPAPGTLAAIGLAGVVSSRRRRG
jgi:hypothetical protein